MRQITHKPLAVTALFILCSTLSNVVAQPSPSLAPAPAAVGSLSPSSSGLGASTDRPTGSPVERSDITVFNDGVEHRINDGASSYKDESIVVSDHTTLILEAGGSIAAPMNTTWPAIRLSINSTFNGTGGEVYGSVAGPEFEDGGGEAIHVFNGQSSAKTASRAEFYDGILVIGGDAPQGIGGNALYVHGIGTEAYIYGGTFTGGKGRNEELDGLSLYVLNSAEVHVYGGYFDNPMEVTNRGVITFHGCFLRNGTRVYGLYPDETELDIEVKMTGGGEVVIIPDGEQECETAPSVSPTKFPTLSPQPTITRSDSVRKTHSIGMTFVELFILLHTAGVALFM